MMELVDMRDLGSREAIRVGSSPTTRTKTKAPAFAGAFVSMYVLPLEQRDTSSALLNIAVSKGRCLAKHFSFFLIQSPCVSSAKMLVFPTVRIANAQPAR